MTVATMTSKGQITIPAATRSKLRLAPGSKVDFVENEAGEIVLETHGRRHPAAAGDRQIRRPPVSVEDLNKAIGDAAAESFRRSTS